MKKYLLPLMLACLAAGSCNLNGTYYIENADDFVTTRDSKLVNDYGATYTVTEDSSSKKWKEEGLRSYIVFDIKDRDYNITLKSVTPATISEPVLKDLPNDDPHDPISPVKAFVSGGYLNMVFNYYIEKGSDFLHTISLLYEKPESGIMKLYLMHDGNNENPAYMDEDKLETVSKTYSFPLKELVKNTSGVTSLALTIDSLIAKSDEGYEVRHTRLLNISVQ